MKRKIAVTTSEVSEGQIKKIASAAPAFDVLHGEDAAANIGECEVIFGHAGHDLLARAKNLKWLHSFSAGVEHYLKPEAKLAESVILTNSAGMHGVSISEHMIGMCLMLMRRLHNYYAQQNRHEWKYLGNVRSIYKSNVTVVGLGGIGSHFASRCKALGAVVYGVVRTPRKDVPDCADKIFTVQELDEAIENADVVALTLPGTAETKCMFDKNRMLKMKKGAIIINIGRGTAIEQDALIELLGNGHIGGAGLDVTDPEPLPTDSKLWDFENVIITPHISGGGTLPITVDFIVDRFIAYLKDYVDGKPFEKVVDRKSGY